jgi:hypothetical protein
MLFNRFINRHQELNELTVFLLGARRLRKIVLVTGRSGVGKSELTDEVIRRTGIVLFIRVSCPVPPCDKTVRDGAFLRNLSDQLHQSAARYGLPSMEQFANRLGTRALTEDYHKRLLEDGRRLQAVAAVHALLQIIRRVQGRFYTAAEMYRPSANWEPIIHRDYVLHALQNEEATIALENFQLIDHESLIHIHDLMRTLPKVSWIIEYTGPGMGDPELRAFEEFRALCETRAKLLPLSPLPLTEIVSAAPNSQRTETDLIQRQYEDHGGNLRVLLDTSILLRDGARAKTLYAKLPAEGTLDATVVLLETLDPGSLFLLAIVLANDARVEVAIAEAICNERASSVDWGTFANALVALKANNLLLEESGFLRIGHDRIAKAFDRGASRRLVLSLALRTSADFYEGSLRQKQHGFVPEREVTARLLKIYLQTQPLMILAHFEHLRSAVLGSASRHDARRFLETAMVALRSETGVAERAWWQLAHLCYEANLFELALSAAEERGTSVRWHLLRGLALHNLDRNDEGLEEANLALSQASAPAAKVAALLVAMICHRAEARFAEADEIAMVIDDDHSFRDEPEYAYFLRSLESIRDPQTSLFLAQESVGILHGHRLFQQENKARITLAMQLARTGRTDQALAELRIVEKTEGLPITDRHMIWNNICATEMLRGNWETEQGFLLRRAHLICAANFDRMVVGNNIAVWYAHRGDFNNAQRQFAELATLVDAERDPRLRCALFFNQAQLARLVSDAGGEFEWRSHLRREAQRVDGSYRAYWRARSSANNAVEECFRFMLSRPFHYVFLAHWSFPIRSDIEG